MQLDRYSIVLYLQVDQLPAAGTHAALVNKDVARIPGGMSLELYNDGGTGRLRGYSKTAAGDVEWFGSKTGAGEIHPGVGYRIALTVGSDGTRLYLNDDVVSASPNREGWARNSQDISIGVWPGGLTPFIGRMTQFRLYDRPLPAVWIELLPDATTVPRDGDGEPANIKLDPIHVWQDDKGRGEVQITDTATGGEIRSRSGGTLPAFPIEVDPTPYVDGARLSKVLWRAEFRNSSLGEWSRLANGDFRFTPGPRAGEDESQYRISDDGGQTWSPWQTIRTLVLDRRLTPGPYFLIEDYDGSNNGLDKARDAAAAAGGGTVTTLDRDKVYTGVNNHLVKPNVHYLFLRVKRPNSRHSSGIECGPTGGKPGTGWQPDWHDDVFNAEEGNLAGKERVNLVGVTIDGNSFKQALRDAYKPTPLPASQWGRCWPGDRTNAAFFNIQHMALIGLKGANTAAASGRAKLGLYGCHLFNSCADGLQGTGASDGVIEHCRFFGCYRGGVVFDFGNSMIRSKRNVYLPDRDNNIGCGIDHEILGHANSWYQDIRQEDEFIDTDFDFNIRADSKMVFAGCTIGPGLEIMAKAATGATVTWEGSERNPRGTIRYHRKGGGASGEYPRSSIFGWGGTAPHNATFKFIDQDFETWGGGAFPFRSNLIRPLAGWTYVIELGQTVDLNSNFIIWLANCTASVGKGTLPGTYLLFKTVKKLTTKQIVRLDGLTIGEGFEKTAVQLNGQRLEYRNVKHEGYPGADIKECQMS